MPVSVFSFFEKANNSAVVSRKPVFIKLLSDIIFIYKGNCEEKAKEYFYVFIGIPLIVVVKRTV